MPSGNFKIIFNVLCSVPSVPFNLTVNFYTFKKICKWNGEKEHIQSLHSSRLVKLFFYIHNYTNFKKKKILNCIKMNYEVVFVKKKVLKLPKHLQNWPSFSDITGNGQIVKFGLATLLCPVSQLILPKYVCIVCTLLSQTSL